MPNKELLYAANKFYKLSSAPDFISLVSGMKAHLSSELATGISAINRLMTTDKEAAASEGILAIDENFGRIANEIQNLNENTAPAVVKSLIVIIGQAMFRTSPTNAGMGYDPNTRKGGDASPGASVDRLYVLAKKLDAIVKANPQ